MTFGSLPFFLDCDFDVRQRERREQHLWLRGLQALGQRVWADHYAVRPYLAALFKLRFDLADVRLECPAEDVDFENARGERVLDCVVDLLRGDAAGEWTDGYRDLLLLGLSDRMNQAARALDCGILPVKPANHFDVVFELGGFGATRRRSLHVALPIFDRIAAERHYFEGTTRHG